MNGKQQVAQISQLQHAEGQMKGIETSSELRRLGFQLDLTRDELHASQDALKEARLSTDKQISEKEEEIKRLQSSLGASETARAEERLAMELKDEELKLAKSRAAAEGAESERANSSLREAEAAIRTLEAQSDVLHAKVQKLSNSLAETCTEAEKMTALLTDNEIASEALHRQVFLLLLASVSLLFFPVSHCHLISPRLALNPECYTWIRQIEALTVKIAASTDEVESVRRSLQEALADNDRQQHDKQQMQDRHADLVTALRLTLEVEQDSLRQCVGDRNAVRQELDDHKLKTASQQAELQALRDSLVQSERLRTRLGALVSSSLADVVQSMRSAVQDLRVEISQASLQQMDKARPRQLSPPARGRGESPPPGTLTKEVALSLADSLNLNSGQKNMFFRIAMDTDDKRSSPSLDFQVLFSCVSSSCLHVCVNIYIESPIGTATAHAPCMHHACKMLTCLRVCTRIHARVCVAVCVCANQDGPIDKTPLFETLEHLTSKSEQVAACCQLASRSGSHLGLPLSVSLRTLHVHACTQLALQRRLSDAGRADVAA